MRFTILQSAPLRFLVLLSANVVLALPIATNIGQGMLQNISSRSGPTVPERRTLSQIGIKAPPDEYKIGWQRQMAYNYGEMMVHTAIYRDLMHLMDAQRDPPDLWLKLWSGAITEGPKTFWLRMKRVCQNFIGVNPHYPLGNPSLQNEWTEIYRFYKRASEATDEQIQELQDPSKVTDNILFNFILPETSARLSARAEPSKHRNEYWTMTLMKAYYDLKQWAGVFAESVCNINAQQAPPPATWDHMSTNAYWDEIIKAYDRISKEKVVADQMPLAHGLLASKKEEALNAKKAGTEPLGVLTYQSELRLVLRDQPHMTPPTFLYYTPSKPNLSVGYA